MKITRKRRSPISWRRLARTGGILLAIELLFTLVIGIGPVIFSGIVLYNGCQSARAAVMDALIRPKDPGPRPDAKVISAVNDFGFRLLSELTQEDVGQNVFVSPCSIANGMAMAYNGASGHTQVAMAKALGLNGIPLADVNEAYARIGSYLVATDPRIQVANAHGIWVDDEARLAPDFARRMEDSFGAEAKALDLQAPGAENQINGWIRAKTRGRIGRVVDSLGRAEGVVLVDALTFHGTWTNQFKKGNTRPDVFRRLDGTEITVPMMHQKEKVGFLWDNNADIRAARLPYGGGSMAMYLFVPDEADGLPAFLKTLSAERWEEWMGRFREREVRISLPRFRAEFAADLREPLVAVGLGEAFGRDPTHPADFTAMTDAGLHLGRVLHRTRLEVDEKGTRAEAVTVQLMMFAGTLSIRADRPFFCAIRDERTGLILFAGAIYDPEALK